MRAIFSLIFRLITSRVSTWTEIGGPGNGAHKDFQNANYYY